MELAAMKRTFSFAALSSLRLPQAVPAGTNTPRLNSPVTPKASARALSVPG